MANSQDLENLFESMKNVDRTETSRRNSLMKINQKIKKKHTHYLPNIFSGLIIGAVLFFLVITLLNDETSESLTSGSFDNNEIVFLGSSENWSMQYISTKYINEKGNEIENISYSITFIGDDPLPQQINYYQIGSSSGENVQLSNKGVLDGKSECSECATIQKTHIIEAQVKWEGKLEKIKLKNQ